MAERRQTTNAGEGHGGTSAMLQPKRPVLEHQWVKGSPIVVVVGLGVAYGGMVV